MKHYTASTAALLALVVMVAPCFAQLATQVSPGQAQGLFSNFPVGLSVTDPGGDDPLLIRSPGVAAGVPVAWDASLFGQATPVHPDYSTHALTDHWRLLSLPLLPEFGGISTGGEVMPDVNGNGEMIMTSTNWFMLSLTVDHNAHGVGGSVLASRTAGGRNPAGDILSYYAIGSTGINPAFVDTARLEYSREQLQLQQVLQNVSGDHEIANFDFGMGVVSVDPYDRAGNMFPVRICFYFTLTQAWVSAAHQLNGSYTVAGYAPDAATIYVMTWDSTPGLHWSPPMIAFSRDELFGEGFAGAVEIDALSVDQDGGIASRPDRAVFSLTPGSDPAFPALPYDQILVSQREPQTCLAKPLKTDGAFGTSTRVSTKFGLVPRTPPTGLPDNVTGTCGGDPIEPYLVGAVVGIATNQWPHGQGTLGLTAVRTSVPIAGSDGQMVHTIHLQAAGMDYYPYPIGYIQFFVEGSTSQTLGYPCWISPSATQSNTIDVSAPMTIKPGVPTRFSARCYGLNPATGETEQLRESWFESILY